VLSEIIQAQKGKFHTTSYMKSKKVDHVEVYSRMVVTEAGESIRKVGTEKT
jgi:hypothetical protein